MSETAAESWAPGGWGRRLGLAAGLSVIAAQAIAIATWVASTSHPPEGTTNLGWGLYLVIPLEAAGLLVTVAAIVAAVIARRPWGTGRTVVLAILGLLFLAYAATTAWMFGLDGFAEVQFFFGYDGAVLQLLGLAAVIIFLGAAHARLSFSGGKTGWVMAIAAVIVLAVQAYNWHPYMLDGYTDCWQLSQGIGNYELDRDVLFDISLVLAATGLAAAPILGLLSAAWRRPARGLAQAAIAMTHIIAGTMILLAAIRWAMSLAHSDPGMLFIGGLRLAALVTFFAGAYLCAACASATLRRVVARTAPPTTVLRTGEAGLRPGEAVGG
jgi:hypothetical protein